MCALFAVEEEVIWKRGGNVRFYYFTARKTVKPIPLHML